MRSSAITGLVASIAVIGASPLGFAGQDPEYALFILNKREYGMIARAINNDGVIAGSLDDAFSPDFDAGVWSRRGVLDLRPPDLPADEDSRARGISDAGDVVGSRIYGVVLHRALLWSDGKVIELGTLGGAEQSEAYDVNSDGMVVGVSTPVDRIGGAFVWQDGVMTNLGSVDGESTSVAFALNELGDVAGSSSTRDNGGLPVVWIDGEIMPLPMPDDFGYARDINDLGDAVGWTSAGYGNAAYWHDGKHVNIHDYTIFGINSSSSARALNNVGEIVGYVANEGVGDDVLAFVWRDGEMELLHDLIPPMFDRRDRWVLDFPHDINDHGQIVGRATKNLFNGVGFLASPVRPTLAAEPPVPGRAGEVNTVVVTGAEPGAEVYLGWGEVGGGTLLGECDLRDGAAWQIDGLRTIGPFVADATGRVEIVIDVAPEAAERSPMLLQVGDPTECAISNLLVVEFE